MFETRDFYLACYLRCAGYELRPPRLACHLRVPSRPQAARQAQPLGARNFHDFRLCRINFGMNETGVDA
jgi:hypothetical protein